VNYERNKKGARFLKHSVDLRKKYIPVVVYFISHHIDTRLWYRVRGVYLYLLRLWSKFSP